MGWITGHFSLYLYAVKANGATTLIFEGVPSWPDFSRFYKWFRNTKWIFFTAPTANPFIRKAPLSFVHACDLSSLQVLGTGGWTHQWRSMALVWWTHRPQNAPLFDTWWQRKLVVLWLRQSRASQKQNRHSPRCPCPVQPAVMSEQGVEQSYNGIEGRLAVKFPWSFHSEPFTVITNAFVKRQSQHSRLLLLLAMDANVMTMATIA